MPRTWYCPKCFDTFYEVTTDGCCEWCDEVELVEYEDDSADEDARLDNPRHGQADKKTS